MIGIKKTILKRVANVEHIKCSCGSKSFDVARLERNVVDVVFAKDAVPNVTPGAISLILKCSNCGVELKAGLNPAKKGG